MEVIIKIGFFANYNKRTEIEDFFRNYDIQVDVSKRLENIDEPEVHYQIPIIIDEKNTIATIDSIFNKLKNLLNFSKLDEMGESISFKFDDRDFAKSPFYELCSTGNSAKAFLKHEKSGMEWKTICKGCDIKAKEQNLPLVMDTSKMGDRYMVNVDTDYWVVSEKMALLMEGWKITGYKLQKVIHTGTKIEQPTYQMIPTNILPPWSSEMKHYHFITQPEDHCPVCNVKGRIDFPYHYNKIDLEQFPIEDVNIMREWKSNGLWAYCPVFFSKRFRNLLIENGITRDVRDRFSGNYKSKDWLFDPVIIIGD